MWQVVLSVLLAALLIGAGYLTWNKLRRGGGCCGEHEASVRRIAVPDKNKAHYPYCVTLTIGGMTCQNCAVRVENALNALDGTWARVSLDTKTARVLSKQPPDLPLLCRTVAQAGYAAQVCK